MKEFKNLTELTKDVSKIYNNLVYTLALLCILCLLHAYIYNQQTKRLDAHKEVIEIQQKQINQLIINAKYERNGK